VSTVRYPIPEFGGVFSTDVCIFRASEAQGYAFLPPQRVACVSVLTVAAYAHPPVSKGRLKSDMEKKTFDKITAMLRQAQCSGVTSLVLSAFGCGAFENPPLHIAELFRDALLGEFRGHFRRVVFAIIEDHNSRGVNVGSFHKVLCQ